jgi:cell division septum initiation protein DivIVA
VKGEPPRIEQPEVEPVADVQDLRSGLARHEEPVSPDLLAASFPISMRGYSREPVDAHIERLNRVIAELEMNRSPRSAVRNALDRVGEQTAGILRQARGAAEEILSSANEEADEITSRAAAAARELIVDASDDADRSRAEAAELVRAAREEAEGLLAQAREDAARMASQAQSEADHLRLELDEELEARRAEAEARMLEVRADTDAVWEERHDLLGEIREFAAQARALASEAAQRLPDQTEDEAAAAERAESGLGAGDDPGEETGVMPAPAGAGDGDSGTQPAGT